MPGSVASGAHCTNMYCKVTYAVIVFLGDTIKLFFGKCAVIRNSAQHLI